MDIRHGQFVLISKRVEKANDKINEILEKLGWTREELKQWHNERKKLQLCPFDKRHGVPEMTMKNHYRRCLLKSRGILQVAKNKSPGSSLFFYKDASSVISFLDHLGGVDTCHKNIIDAITLPPHERYYVKELAPLPSTAEKCQAYDQVIQRSRQLKRHDSILSSEMDQWVFEKQKKQKKKLHEEQQLLNKRRRKQYRIKMKLTTPTEIQRELINAYMQEYGSKQKA